MFRLFNAPVYGVKYIRYRVPGSLLPEENCEAWIRIENTGAKVWQSNPLSGGRVNFVAYVDGALSGTFTLPQEVRPRQCVDLSFSFRAPSELGFHTLKCDLVEQNVTLFEDQGIEPLILEFEVVALDDSREKQNARRLTDLPQYGVRWIHFDILQKARAGARFCGRVCLENRGTLVWRSGPSVQNSVDLAVFINKVSVASVNLPLPKVGTAGRVTVHFSIPAPDEQGRHELKIDLVKQGVTLFEHQGVAPLSVEFETGSPDDSLTGKLFEAAIRRNSWFYRPTSGISRSRDGMSFPVFVSRANGYHIWDTDGRRYIDYTMGWGCALLGYANDRIRRAMIKAMDSAAILPFPDPLMVEVSEILCEDIPCAEMVAFGKNGSDVCLLAIRLARLYTGRRKVLVCGYHGFHDWYAELIGFEQSGVPDRAEKLIFQFKFNDYDDFEGLLRVHQDDLAAVMLEPSGPGEDIQGPRQDVSREFLEKVAANTRRVGALLIYDEIITGFRYLGGSVQKATGIFPDLACFGKALGAGAPVSALVGRRDIISGTIPRAFYGPTFKDETYSLACAKEALSIYRSEPVAEHVWDFGSRMKEEVNKICRSRQLPAAMVGPPFRFTLVFSETDPLRLTQLRTLYQQELLKGGIITYNSVMLPSYAHDNAAFRQSLEVIAKSLDTVNTAFREGTLERYIEIPLLPP